MTAALVIAITLVPMLEWLERRGVPSRFAAAVCVDLLPLAGVVRRRVDRPAGNRLGRADSRADSEGEGGARARPRPVQVLRPVHRADPVADDDPGQRPDSPDRDSQFAVGPAHLVGAAPAHPALLRAAGHLLLPRRLDGDAEADDRQPRKLRRRADHRARHPAGRRRDLDLHRHDHPHQRGPGRADGADPVAAGHGFADHVGRHRRGAELHPLSRPDRRRRSCCSSAG